MSRPSPCPVPGPTSGGADSSGPPSPVRLGPLRTRVVRRPWTLDLGLWTQMNVSRPKVRVPSRFRWPNPVRRVERYRLDPLRAVWSTKGGAPSSSLPRPVKLAEPEFLRPCKQLGKYSAPGRTGDVPCPDSSASKSLTTKSPRAPRLRRFQKRLAVLGVLRALVVQKPFRDKVAELATFLISVASVASC
jgi:hypothetical protein